MWQASGEITEHFKSKVMEPRLLILEGCDGMLQMFVCAEDDGVLELPATTFGEWITYLMGAYYVYNVQYPKVYQPLLFFFQDFLMDRVEAKAKRPTRYSTFAATITI